MLTASRDLSATTPKPRGAGDADVENMDPAENIPTGHRASFASALTVTGSIQGSARDKLSGGRIPADVSLDSLETQICAPRHGGSGVHCKNHPPPPRESRNEGNNVTKRSLLAHQSHSSSAKGTFLEPTVETPQRPLTPTPYSILRKVSEISEPACGDESDHRRSQRSSSGSQHQGATRHSSAVDIPQVSTTQGNPANDHIAAKGSTGGSHMDRTTPVLRDEEGRVLARVQRLSRLSGTLTELQQAQYVTASSSIQANHGSYEDVTAPEGIVVFQPGETTEETFDTAGTPTRNTSLYSRRATTILGDFSGLESLRRGPRLRHNLLPLSPSMAAKAGRKVPESTKKLWAAVGRWRKMVVVSGVLLELSIFSFISSITAVIVSHAEGGPPGAGLVAWAIVSSVFTLAFSGLLTAALLQYRKMNKVLVSGEDWIEMHHLSRPLPPRPRGEERKQDNGAAEAWQNFARDHKQLRRYVEFLESRIGVLEEGRPDGNQRNEESSADAFGIGNNTAADMENVIGQRSGGNNIRKEADDKTPKAKKVNVGGSMSRRQLLLPEESIAEAESWQGSDGNGTIPKSDTKASILTELCEAVTEGYSPLAEHMPRGSPHIPQTPDTHTPSFRQRGDAALRHLFPPGKVAAQQRGAHLGPEF